MKTKTLSLLFFISSVNLMGQSIELETTDINNRTMLELNFPTDITQTANSLKITAGLNDLSETELASWGGSYTATTGYGGYGGLTQRQNGIIIRAVSPIGQIKFLTGGSNVSASNRMTIDEAGNVGLATDNPFSRLQLQSGDIFLNEINRGVIMKSPNGNCWKLQVSNSGAPSFSAINCPNTQN